MAEAVTIFEMGPRDGLQNEARMIATADKIRLVDMLTDAGFSKIEVASFVSPRWVPQMADGAEVLSGISRRAGVRYTALTPNMKGYANAKAALVDEIAIFGSASEGFSRSNLNKSREDALEMFRPVAEAAKADAIPMRGYVSCVTDCPFDGPTAPGDVAQAVAAMLALGCYEVSLGDTIGQGTPDSIAAMLEAVLNVAPARRLAGHYHDTAGRALANIEVSLDKGLRVFDTAVGGLGGCPYAPGAKGNVATEAVAALVDARGFETGLDAGKLAEAALFAKELRS
ncbi:MAG: hydroxymethylglutaryl-CoA lyase [Pseudomonadota bacterium]